MIATLEQLASHDFSRMHAASSMTLKCFLNQIGIDIFICWSLGVVKLNPGGRRVGVSFCREGKNQKKSRLQNQNYHLIGKNVVYWSKKRSSAEFWPKFFACWPKNRPKSARKVTNLCTPVTMYNLYQMLPSFNEFRGAIDRERNGSTGKEMAQPGKQTPSEGEACPLCYPASYATSRWPMSTQLSRGMDLSGILYSFAFFFFLLKIQEKQRDNIITHYKLPRGGSYAWE